MAIDISGYLKNQIEDIDKEKLDIDEIILKETMETLSEIK
jgi:hypothetical protein